MNIEDLIKAVINAVNLFIKNDIELLELKVYELAVSHRIAHYLEQEKNFKGMNLNFDCEYDKRQDQMKPGPDGKPMRPDILVHKRNESTNNIIAIEIKKDRNNKWDREKLKYLTNQKELYKYKLGVFIYFPKDKVKFRWFTDGND